MEQDAVQSVLLPLLTSIITGGFILVLIEIGNRKNREADWYELIMRPFMHKLSSYFRYVSCCVNNISYPKELDENEESFNQLVEEMGKYGSDAVSYGCDYGYDHFSANKIDRICSKINKIWYSFDKMNPCRMRWCDGVWVMKDMAEKELKEFSLVDVSHAGNIYTLAKVSGDFYIDTYQPIEKEILRHETYVHLFKKQTFFMTIAVTFVLIVLALMLFTTLPIWFMRVAGVVAIALLIIGLLILCVDAKQQIKFFKLFAQSFPKVKG